MADLLWFNGIDAEDLGFIVTEAPDLLSEGERAPQTVSMPQGVGALLASVAPSIGTRVLRLSGYVSAATNPLSKTALDRVAVAIGNGLVDIRSAWDTSMLVRGTLINRASAPSSSAWLGRLDVTLDFLLADPFGYALNPSTIAFGATPVAIPLGTAPSRGREGWSAIITITGAATTPTLTEYDATGTALRTMAFTTSPGASDAIEIDIGRGLVTAIASGVRTNGIGNLTAGYEFPSLDPADGNWYTSAWPMLAVSSGAASISYTKAYR